MTFNIIALHCLFSARVKSPKFKLLNNENCLMRYFCFINVTKGQRLMQLLFDFADNHFTMKKEKIIFKFIMQENDR